MNNKKITYSKYLQLDKILEGQNPLSNISGKPIHDETLFIIIHQIYELWFKQIIHEIDSVINYFSNPSIKETNTNTVVSRLNRIHDIQKIALSQIDILKSMTPMDFLEFRDLLNPASGFQSVQFREIEIKLGMDSSKRVKFGSKKMITNSKTRMLMCFFLRSRFFCIFTTKIITNACRQLFWFFKFTNNGGENQKKYKIINKA